MVATNRLGSRYLVIIVIGPIMCNLLVISILNISLSHWLFCFSRSLALWTTLEDVPVFGWPSRAPQPALGHQVQRERRREHRQEEGLRGRVQSPVKSGCSCCSTGLWSAKIIFWKWLLNSWLIFQNLNINHKNVITCSLKPWFRLN